MLSDLTRKRGLAAIAALVAAILLISVQPALAASSCIGAGWLCLWDDQGPSGNRYGNLYSDNHDWRLLSHPYGNWNDRADWFWNSSTNNKACLFRDINYQPQSYASGSHIQVWMGDTYVWHDEASSNYWIPSSQAGCV